MMDAVLTYLDGEVEQLENVERVQFLKDGWVQIECLHRDHYINMARLRGFTVGTFDGQLDLFMRDHLAREIDRVRLLVRDKRSPLPMTAMTRVEDAEKALASADEEAMSLCLFKLNQIKETSV